MNAMTSLWARLTAALSGPIIENIVLLITRIGLGMIFWNSYKTKIVEGTWFTANENQSFLFGDVFRSNPYDLFGIQINGLPIPDSLAIPMSIYAEFALPLLLFLGVFSRFSAFGLFMMALTIQVFVFPTFDHFSGWFMMVTALAAVIVTRGPGVISLDWVLGKVSGLSVPPTSELKTA
ncbi:MAG: DoxX family protein [Pseudomonadota bacterium]